MTYHLLQSLQRRWQPRSISARLYAIVAVALVAVELLAAASIHYAETTGDVARTLGTDTLPALVRAAEFERTFGLHRRIVESAPSVHDPARLQAARLQLADLEVRLVGLASATSENHARRIEMILPRLHANADRVIALSIADMPDQAGAAAYIYAAGADALEALVRQWRGQRFLDAERSAVELVEAERSLLGWVFATALVALVLIGPVSLLLMRSVAGRLGTIAAVMIRLSRNDTSFVVPLTEERDEVGEMARAVGVFKANAVALLENRARLTEVNGWLDIALNNMTRGLSMFDAERKLVLANGLFKTMYGLPDDLVRRGTPAAHVIQHRRTKLAELARLDNGETVPASEQDLFATLANTGTATAIQTFEDGRIISIAMQAIASGGWVAVHQDITRERQAEDRMARLARNDTLTGLVNRRVFQDELRRIAANPDRPGFTLFSIDLDGFKEINDTLGHQAGDALLQAVAERLATVTRRKDLLARLGGDEFAIIGVEIADAERATIVANRIVAAIAKPFELAGTTASVGASVGMSLVAHGETIAAEQLLNQADLALYKAKTDGRGVARVFEPALRARVDERRTLEQDLRRALENAEFALVYQPILSLSRGIITGCEALIRWHHPQRGLVSPAEFIPIAEQIGLIGLIGKWALETACRAATAWPDGVTVAVNLSAAQFTQRHLAADVMAALASSGLPARRLELEVTESVLLADSNETVASLHCLRDLGIAIALDDFGTGYASLSYLRSFPFDKLKIDQSFVRDHDDRNASVAIIQSVTTLAHSLSMRAVAEGVETTAHLERVRAAGCDEIQGYLFSRPVPENEILAVIHALNRRQERRSA